MSNIPKKQIVNLIVASLHLHNYVMTFEFTLIFFTIVQGCKTQSVTGKKAGC